MKIITALSNWDIDKLYQFLLNKLNALFMETRQTDIEFKINREGDTIEIRQPEYYEGYLFQLTAKGRELHVAKSEHYVDDVNQLTLQNILETLQMEYKDGADIVKISGE